MTVQPRSALLFGSPEIRVIRGKSLSEAAIVHGTAVAIDGRGVLLTGRSGAGKSDLALRLIDRGATLVADDCTRLAAVAGSLFVSAPRSIRGLFEVRGIGIIEMPFIERVALKLIVHLGGKDVGPSLTIQGVDVPIRCLDGFSALGPYFVEASLCAGTKVAEESGD